MTPTAEDMAFPRLAAVATAAVAAGTVPGLAVAVGARPLSASARPWARLCFGTTGEPGTPVTPHTSYDLASLTKALCTSLLTMQAEQAGLLRLDDPLSKFVPAPEGATIAHALAHCTGWPAHARFYERLLPNATGPMPGRERFAARVVELAAQTPLEAAPGTRTLYSDLGFIVLGHVLQTVFAAPLDVAFRQRVALPLACPRLTFNPTMQPGAGPFAPTERCGWRGRLLEGEVHDQNAWVMGGVAGHAGLFGALDDVATLVDELVRTHRGQPRALPGLSTETLTRHWGHRGVGTWALGWDRPSPHGSLAGARISREAVGHLAFTGCSVWVDPHREIFVVTLSNRVHPVVRDDPAFRALRPAIMDAAFDDLEALARAAP